MQRHPVITYRAFYNQENNDKHDTQTQVIVAESARDFTERELDQLAKQHGVTNILVEEISEYI
ncbi:hypothetical protein YOLOSWAG_195 [Erwinia phage vB_EamM_Yoloswag]|uniref:Uncharacterized protein n=1 Tax=Erwinia phage vB_EamM_Yoloswag TaxID=1958956 RepID=A0A1S6L3B5_9CAUD|nr:hypothetical protein HOR66_gp195 [Erwinia phage vB_EamM_Yoloswag]AQT28674.1 hypothetical protein YOLOSWAG_195 [Erwinia phage vB_EamM_Yoloswag]